MLLSFRILVSRFVCWLCVLFVVLVCSASAADVDLFAAKSRPYLALLVTEQEYVQKSCEQSQLDCDVTDPEIQIRSIANGVNYSNINSAQGDDLWFKLVVPKDAVDVRFNISGGIGDADMYVKFNRFPTDDDWDCRPMMAGNDEQCVLSDAGGTYFIRIKSYVGFAALSFTARYSQVTRTHL